MKDENKKHTTPLIRKARKLAEQLEVQPPPVSTPVRPFRPITGWDPSYPLPPIRPAHILHKRGPKRKRGRPKSEEPLDKFIMYMTRREKLRWQRAARDLGIPLAGMMRLAMRYLMGSKKMRSLIELGPREIEFRKVVRLPTIHKRLHAVFGPDDAEKRTSPARQLKPSTKDTMPEPAPRYRRPWEKKSAPPPPESYPPPPPPEPKPQPPIPIPPSPAVRRMIVPPKRHPP